MRRSTGVAAAVAGAVLADRVYATVVRPWHLDWGASEDEVRRFMPGDEQVADPVTVSTRAVTVDADPGAVWPWLAQLGDGRGGLYSYDFLDRLFGYLRAPSATEVLPQWQAIHAGDVVPLGRGPSWPVTMVDPERFLVLTPVDEPRFAVTWAFGLYPVDRYTTRLVTRVRVRYPVTPLGYLPAQAWDLAAFVMTRRMLLNLKQRAEHLSHQRVLTGEVPGIVVPPRPSRRRMPVGVEQ